MKVLTEAFETDAKDILIDCSAKQRGKPRIRRTAVIVGRAETDMKQQFFEAENQYVGFQTVFTLYRTRRNYILQISGVSAQPSKFPTRNKIVEFETPQEFVTILADKTDNTVYWSPLTEALLDSIQDSEYLTEHERYNWERALIEEEE